ncbi:UDP-glucose 4-epimerase family protein [Vibrio salinus]|uniref:UDP-glucose 4-epimerase family protein n=1 Tax=Vibrio salinus TaxID=2899784 RepID=UPI001E2B2CAD|nr:SDR family oxidoreductase [Vibrio salinus]MCE0493787.1 SDR family oxidoreductase [Vibrio salinus]
MNKILVTGSGGFVGKNLVHQLLQQRNEVIAHSRSVQLTGCENVHSEISSLTDWSGVLTDVDAVIHCAARVHQMNESQQEAKILYHEVNVAGSLNLAKQAVEAGVKRFIFISSIKVNGEWTNESEPFTADDMPHPQDAYGQSKYDAECALIEFAQQSGLELVIIRPPLVYGPGVKANFLSMMKVVAKGVPLPFGAIKSLRSFVYVENLVNLILVCCEHTKAPGKIFLISDDEDISIRELLRQLAQLSGKKSYLLPIPKFLLISLLTLIGKKAAAQRLCQPLQLDIQETKDILGWEPKYSLREGLEKTVDSYLNDVKD